LRLYHLNAQARLVRCQCRTAAGRALSRSDDIRYRCQWCGNRGRLLGRCARPERLCLCDGGHWRRCRADRERASHAGAGPLRTGPCARATPARGRLAGQLSLSWRLRGGAGSRPGAQGAQADRTCLGRSGGRPNVGKRLLCFGADVPCHGAGQRAASYPVRRGRDQGAAAPSVPHRGHAARQPGGLCHAGRGQAFPAIGGSGRSGWPAGADRHGTVAAGHSRTSL
ncbi:hypothetical protein LTR94_025903, partial [Friedmanniomyces endolithicus]